MPLPVSSRPARHPRYTYLTADMATGTILEEVPLGSVKWSKTLNGAGSCTGSFVYTPRTAALLRPATTPALRALYVLRDNQAVWGGVIWGRRVKHRERIVDLTCADFWSYYTRRFITTTQQFAQVDQNAIMRALVTYAESAGGIGMTYDTTVSGILRDRTYYGFDFGNVAQRIEELAALIDGVDVRFDVTGTGAGVTRVMLTGSPFLGRSANGSGLVLDFGAQGTTLDDWQEDENGTNTATVQYAIGPGQGEGKLLGIATSATLTVNGWPRLEAVRSYSDSGISQQPTIDSYAQSNIAATAGIQVGSTGGSRALSPQDLQPGDTVAVSLEAPWYNTNPVADLTDVSQFTTRVTAYDVNVPDDGSNELISPTFGAYVRST